jgi:hypothetical protein
MAKPLRSRRQATDAITAVLAAKGVGGATPALVGEVLAAWLAGVRGVNLPHGLLGVAAAEVIEDLERHAPGALARLAKR